MKNVNYKDIQKSWHLIDAKNKILGRLASDVSVILMGKNKGYYTPHLDTGDNVVVINAKDVILTGKKENQKKYFHHSQYPGGLYKKSAQDIRAQKPQELIKHAVKGMLPKTKLGKDMLKKLYVFAHSNNPYQDKIKS